MMKKILFAILLAVPLLAALAPAAANAAPMTNDDVIKMVKGGLGDATVLQAIEGAEHGFDTSPDGLVRLKQGGVSEAVIQKILGKKTGATKASAAPVCNECGSVTGIREVNKPGHATGLGAVAGGVLGGVLGRSVGGSNHRTAGTVVGAAGGAVAGHVIEKKAREGKVFEIDVRFDDGSTRTITQETHPSLSQGSRVKLVNGALAPL
jgi:outer membrane lipoprotein SlyB